jgi:hypothetical protein
MATVGAVLKGLVMAHGGVTAVSSSTAHHPFGLIVSHQRISEVISLRAAGKRLTV